jgi:hypothetical protein
MKNPALGAGLVMVMVARKGLAAYLSQMFRMRRSATAV